jgi:XRE family aerobic/anaerobic benzoate catabolism transcriptional regulator
MREIHDLYGTAAYRRTSAAALDETCALHGDAVIATPGGIVAEPATFNVLLAHCATMWITASPESTWRGWRRRATRGRWRASREAMEDLRRILAGRAAFYAKADAVLDTSGRTEAKVSPRSWRWPAT